MARRNCDSNGVISDLEGPIGPGLEITLLRPIWLLALLPLAAIAIWSFRRRAVPGDWQQVINPVLLKAMSAMGRIETTGRHHTMIILCWVVGLSVFALAGPAIERRDTVSYRNLDGVLFVFDVSPSMTQNPEWHTIQTTARFALSSLGTRPGGLIVFAGDAYVANHMTADHLQLGQTLSLLDDQTVPDQGTRPGRALAMAAELLSQAEIIAGDVVLFTDGGGLDESAFPRIADITAQGARVSVVTMERTSPRVESLASLGQGQVFTADDVNALGDWLAEDTRTRLERQDFPLLYWSDVGRYLLGLALLPMLFLFRKEMR